MATNQNSDEYRGEEFTREEIEAAQLTAYALGQLQGEERAEVERRLVAGAADVRNSEFPRIEALAAAISRSHAADDAAFAPSANLRRALKRHVGGDKGPESIVERTTPTKHAKLGRRLPIAALVVGGGIALILAALLMPASQMSLHSSRLELKPNQIGDSPAPEALLPEMPHAVWDPKSRGWQVNNDSDGLPVSGGSDPGQRMMSRNNQLPPGGPGGGMGGMAGGISGATNHTSNQVARELPFLETRTYDKLKQLEALGAASQAANDAEVEVARLAILASKAELDSKQAIDPQSRKGQLGFEGGGGEIGVNRRGDRWPESMNVGEQYDRIIENAFLSPLQQPLSTFSIDVDTASYANMRRFLTSGRLPPRNSVRIEELVNYFRYEYRQPRDSEPFSVNMEVAECPWSMGHLLLRVGLKGKDVHKSERPASNLVFLLDVSGSMSDENKLPLLKTAMKMLVGELGENDRVSIVTYAGEAGLKLKSTRGNQQQRITRAIDSLSAGGSTNGSAGIELAYEQATANFISGGANRVILCTDGDLNVGVTSDEALTKLIRQKAKSGVFLTVLGFGEGNLKDAKMEKLADNGNGLYAYIDSVREARKVLVEQLTGSTITIAKDVKIQIEFNPAQIAAYRLLGYENRMLAAEDFNNDKKDAGEIGAGHMVTALYELAPVGAADEAGQSRPGTDPLKYQGRGDRRQGTGGGEVVGGFGGFGGGEGVGGGFGGVLPGGVQESGKLTGAAHSGELLTLKLRYKEPDGETSKLLEYPLKERGHSFHSASPDLQFAAAVAGFGMVLRNSQHRGSATLEGVAEIASAALGKDEGGYRAEFVDLVHKAQALGAR